MTDATEAHKGPWIYKYVGRKFIGFVTASALLVGGYLSQDIWLIAFLGYCAADVAEKLKAFRA